MSAGAGEREEVGAAPPLPPRAGQMRTRGVVYSCGGRGRGGGGDDGKAEGPLLR